MKAKAISVGVIAEDDSDVESIAILIRRISKNERLGVKKFVGKGCGKLKRKCNAWSNQLKLKGCTVLILVHDLDRNDLGELTKKLTESINPCPFKKYIICIPIEELEAWFLSDPQAIKTALKLRKLPVVKGLPEEIKSPKEHIGQIVSSASQGETFYIHTKHNSKISSEIGLDNIVSKCPSFEPLYNFVLENCA